MSSSLDDTTNLDGAYTLVQHTSEMDQIDGHKTSDNLDDDVIESVDVNSQKDIPMNLLPAGKVKCFDFLLCDHKSRSVMSRG